MKVNIKKIIAAVCLLSGCYFTTAQSVQIIATGPDVSLRGLSVVDDKIVWVSGAAGTVGKSTDGGKTFEWIKVKGYEKNDFRDIEAFSEKSALIMAVGTPALILKTTDGGNHWRLVFKDETPGMFLDAMEFWNEQSGIIVGDPISSKIFIARTFDGGYSWRGIPQKNTPAADSGEAMFAASGTNVRKLNKQEAVFVTGGSKSRLYIRDKKIDLPFTTGKQTAGANSIAIKNKNIMMVAGGDFSHKDSILSNCFISRNGGLLWQIPNVPPHGYRSCIEFINKTNWVCCGLNGADFSTDDGNTWIWISKQSFNVCRKAKHDNAIFFAGAAGKIGKLIL